jgi:glycosyltransferase involved in cell wall biosynthesis
MNEKAGQQPSAKDACARARVAVIVPAYGVAHHLDEALDSLQAQTMPDWECVVIDDGAPDDVAGAVRPYLSDRRIRFLATGNKGVSAARNVAIRATGAPLLTLLDGDDLLRPDYLERMLPLLEDDPDARIASCNARLFGAETEERLCCPEDNGIGDRTRGTLAEVLARTYKVYIGATFRRADFDKVGGFDESMTHAEDFDFWVRLMLLGGHARFARAVLGDYRVRAASASAQTVRMLRGNIRVYEKARAALAPDRPEIALIDSMIERERATIEFEEAVDSVIAAPNRHGIVRLRAAFRGAQDYTESRWWNAAFSVWSLLPALAVPMLRWRRARHKRGSSTGSLRAIATALAPTERKAA